MKRFLLTIISIVSVFVLNAQQRITADVQSAVVYFSGASLTHSVSTTLKSGTYDILIDGLSPQIELASLKVTANGVLISAVEFSNDYLTLREESAKIKKMQDSLETFKQALLAETNDLNVNTHLLKLVTDGTYNNMTQSEKTVSTADITSNMELYKSKAAPLQNAINQNNKKIAQINESISRLTAQIAQDASNNRHKSGMVRVSVSVPEKVNTKFEIVYFTRQASWIPCYDINIPSVDKPIAFQAKAQVNQRTGLDWNNVKLTLSNANPNRTGAAPILSAWRLHLANPVAVNARYAKTTSNAMVYETQAVAMDAAEVADDAALADTRMYMDDYVSVQEQDVSVNYAIAIPYDVPGNGKAQLIDLKQYQIKAEYFYYSVPKVNEETFLIALLSDYEKYNLLPGYATVSYNNTYVGKTYVQPNSSEENIKLTLTTDPRITVKREKRNEFCATKSIGNSKTETRSYQITVKNNLQKSAKLILKDQYPISADKNIEVKDVEISPNATYNISETGVVTWESEFKAGETKTFVISYTVKYPKDQNLYW